MKKVSPTKTKKDGTRYIAIEIIILLLLVSPSLLRAQNTLDCPNSITSNKCSCYKFEDGIFLDCQDTTTKYVKNTLKSMSGVHSLSVYDLDYNEEALGNFIPQGVCIRHIHMSRTSFKDIADDTFMPLRKCLETLSITSSKLNYIPHKAFSGLLKLISIDLSFNFIKDIQSYSFFGLPLMKLNMKGNIIHDVSETAFSSLEMTLSEIDLNENNLTTFPIASLSKLKHLRSLRLAWNEMSSFPNVLESDLISLEYLDLNSNNFEFISEDCLKFCPSLKILSFHFNFINNIHYRAFYSLKNLESLDLSHNRIKILNPNIFKHNKRLQLIDMSYNHLHHIHGLFCNLKSLTKVVLSHNNILDVPIDSFLNSSKINSIHLDKNCISNIHSESFVNLESLSMLQLDFNYLNKLPQNIFISSKNILKIRLDNNKVTEILEISNLQTLSELRLNNNNIKSISKIIFINCTKLEMLYLDHNEINFVEPNAFANLANLKYLSLHNNHLININNILPKLLSNLHTLHLDSNALSAVSSFTFRSQKYLSHISLKNNRLKFLTKSTLSNLTYLVRIELSNNEFSIIEDFSFQHLNSARYLDFKYNLLRNITNYTFHGLSELEDLDISHNQILYIFDMAFDTLKKLRSLNISYNPLKVLQKNIFQQGLPLSSLYLDHCNIESIENGTFHGLNNLKLLSLKNNSLKASDIISIDASGIKYLYLSYNTMDHLPLESFFQFPLLEVLNLEHCNIEHIFENTFKFNKHLIDFNLAENIVSAIPPKLFNVYNNFSKLNLSNNFLDYVPYDTLQNLTQLEALDISDNLLPKVELSGFEKLTKLKYLIFRKNEIKSVTAGKKVEYNDVISFDISYNELVHLPSVIFEVFPNIQNVNISHNRIVDFDFFMSYKKLSIPLINIDLSMNPAVSWTRFGRLGNNTLVANIYELRICAINMTTIDFDTFQIFVNLQHLYLKFNKIRRLAISPFSRLTLLENLDLSHNKISQVKTSNFRGLNKLRTLCLSYNNIESIETFTEDLGNLKMLDLSHNKLQNILNEDLTHLKELSVFYLSYNNIKYISATAFRNLNKIIQIDLTHNKLQALSIELLTSIENNIREIFLKDNIIICNCERDNTWVWIQDHPKTIESTDVMCLNDDYPKQKCDVPVISQITVDKHKDNSVSVSWFIRNRTAIKSLQILYYNDDKKTDVNSKYLEKNDVSIHITDLKTNKNYVVCILTLYDDPVLFNDDDALELNKTFDENTNNTLRLAQDIAAALVTQSPSSECVSFNTLKKQTGIKPTPNETQRVSSVLNRRLGLIVGSILGCIVFFIMVSVLLYTKFKERERIAKTGQSCSEMTDYHSLQTHSKEDILQHSTTASTDNILLGMIKNRKSSIDHFKNT